MTVEFGIDFTAAAHWRVLAGQLAIAIVAASVAQAIGSDMASCFETWEIKPRPAEKF